MTRDEFMSKAKEEIDKAFSGQRNRMMNLVEQAWAEGKRNAELDEITKIVQGAFEKVQRSNPVTPSYPDPVSPWINPIITCNTAGVNPPEAHYADGDDDTPHKVSMVVCLSCGKRWVAVRPHGTKLTDLECPQCHTQGAAIETGEELEDDGE